MDLSCAYQGKHVITSYSIHYTKLYEKYPELKQKLADHKKDMAQMVMESNNKLQKEIEIL